MKPKTFFIKMTKQQVKQVAKEFPYPCGGYMACFQPLSRWGSRPGHIKVSIIPEDVGIKMQEAAKSLLEL